MSEITRSQLIELSNSAYQLENFDSSRKILLTWLRSYPNDLWARYRLAIVLTKLKRDQEAIRLCETILSLDPEFFEVWSLTTHLYPDKSPEKDTAVKRMKMLRNYAQVDAGGKNKSHGLFAGKKPREKAPEIHETDDLDIVNAIQKAKQMIVTDDLESSFRILRIFCRRWPKALQFKLCLGSVLNQMGKSDEGIKLIHSVVEYDLLGQTAHRVWGDENPYQGLWPLESDLEADVKGLVLPEIIVERAGLNHVVDIERVPEIDIADQFVDVPSVEILPNDDVEPEVEQAVPESDNREEVKPDVQQSDATETKIELFPNNRLLGSRILTSFFSDNSTGQNEKGDIIPVRGFVYSLDPKDVDNRQPVYVVMSTISGLTTKYGKNNKDFIDQEMRSVADAIQNREGWSAMVFYPDEFQSTDVAMGADSIRRAIIDLDNTMKEKEMMIGALLIVGGHDVVPFCVVENPTNDDDISILSDSPYATTMKNKYFDMLWQLGRIPGDNSNDPGLLLSQLREIQNYHIARYEKSKAPVKNKGKKSVFNRSLFTQKASGLTAFGLSCSAWSIPSSVVFDVIGDQKNLQLTPPLSSASFPADKADSVDFGYFNLHGIKGKPNWYGQKKSGEDYNGPSLPVAVEIDNIRKLSATPRVVFTESCYGGETQDRNEANAVSLQMIARDTRVFIGSTAIAYGALTSPLTGADLLAYLFWNHMQTNISCGEAFRRAEKNLAMEIESQTGGLDTEIQKTLESFVYYGDPLYCVSDEADATDLMQRSKVVREYNLYEEFKNEKTTISTDMAKQILDSVKSKNQVDSVNDDYANYSVIRLLPKNPRSSGSLEEKSGNGNYVITYVKDRKDGGSTQRSIIRVTVTEKGVVTKVSVSR